MMTQNTITHETKLRRTPLYETHLSMGAKMVPFAGWEMPIQFGKVLEEHHAVRQAAGLFDICHMGILSIYSGDLEQTRSQINHLVPQDLTKLTPGKAMYTQLLLPEGGIIDDIIVYDVTQTPGFPELKELMIICNASNVERVMSWIRQHVPDATQIDYLNDQYSLIALQGPQFNEVLSNAGMPSDFELPKRFRVKEGQLFNQAVLLSRTGYTGEDGVELLIPANQAANIWTRLLEAGKPLGLAPVGLGARDTLRLEAAYPLYGHDLTEDTTPLEAGLGWSVKLKQDADFIGKSILLQQKEQGLKKHFVCLKLLKKSIARQDDPIYMGEKQIGTVTSGSISPTLNEPIAMGYIQGDTAPPAGTPLQVEVRSRRIDAVIVKRPFYPN